MLCPFFGDQPFWARRVVQLGVGPAPVPQRRLDVVQLAHALSEAVGDAGIRARAAAVGERMAQEDGVATAVAMLERVVG